MISKKHIVTGLATLLIALFILSETSMLLLDDPFEVEETSEENELEEELKEETKAERDWFKLLTSGGSDLVFDEQFQRLLWVQSILQNKISFAYAIGHCNKYQLFLTYCCLKIDFC